MQVITKPAYNEEFRTCQFLRPDGQGQLNGTETIVSADVCCFDRATGEDVAANMIADVSPYDLTQVKYKLSGGTAGKKYTLRIRCVTSNGQKLEEPFELAVI